jgi:N-acetylneuraminate synthase
MSHLNFVAEVGVNHEGSVQSAEEHIKAAAKAGATAVKFQAYKASKIASVISPSYWDTDKEPETSQYKLFSKYDNLEIEDYSYLAKVCADVGVDFMVTCFDQDWLHALDPLVKVHKIASADITNFRLLLSVARTGKKILLSTGASSILEVEIAVKELKSHGAKKIVLMHCVLCYPTKFQDANLGRISSLRELGKKHDLDEVGYSDHTEPTEKHEILVSAIALGATWIEKHFSLTPKAMGNDHYHSFGPENLKSFMSSVSELPGAMNFKEKEFLEIQSQAIKNARRGIYALTDISPGTMIEEDHLIELRPIGLIPSEEIDTVIGKRVKIFIKAGEPLSYESLS